MRTALTDAPIVWQPTSRERLGFLAGDLTHLAPGHWCRLGRVVLRVSGPPLSPWCVSQLAQALTALPRPLARTLRRIVVLGPEDERALRVGSAFAEHTTRSVVIAAPSEVLLMAQGVLVNILAHECAHLLGGPGTFPATVGQDRWRRARACDATARPTVLCAPPREVWLGGRISTGPVPAGEHRARELRVGGAYVSDYVVARKASLARFFASHWARRSVCDRRDALERLTDDEDFATSVGWWLSDRVLGGIGLAADGAPLRFAELWPARAAMLGACLTR